MGPQGSCLRVPGSLSSIGTPVYLHRLYKVDWDQRDGLVVKSTSYPYRGPESVPAPIVKGSQLPETPAPGDPVPSSGLLRHALMSLQTQPDMYTWVKNKIFLSQVDSQSRPFLEGLVFKSHIPYEYPACPGSHGQARLSGLIEAEPWVGRQLFTLGLLRASHLSPSFLLTAFIRLKLSSNYNCILISSSLFCG